MNNRIEIINNGNRVYSEVTRCLINKNLTGNFSIRVAFTGSELYTIGKRQISISPGSFLVINDGTTYNREVYSDMPVQSMSVLYTADFLRSFHHTYLSSDKSLLDDPFAAPPTEVPRFMETLYPFRGDMKFNLGHLKDYLYSDNHNELLMSEYLNHTLINFYRIYNNEILLKSEQLNVLNDHTRTELFRRLTIAKDYMHSNYAKDINLDEICSYACLSETHFFRSFKRVFNCTPHQYLIQLRLLQARHLLRATSYEIREIVNLVGFDCPSSFIRLFKDKFGVTPGNYRSMDKAA